MKELRSYQGAALEAIRSTVAQGVYRLVVQAPTGSGKTLVAADIVRGALRKGNRICFVVPAISLIDQAIEMFYAEGIRDIGVIQANHQMTDWSRPLQVCSIQTIRARQAFPEAKTVIRDEVHQLHQIDVKWLTHPDWQSVPFVGLSATPWTRGLGRYFQSLLVMSTTRELIDLGYLSKFKTYAADHPDLSGVRTVAGDYQENQLSQVMQDDKLTANIVETWRRLWNRDKTFLFCVDLAHARQLQERFQEAGISCGYQDAKTSPAERAALKRAFHNGEVQIIANVGTLTVGVDYDVRCLILARPTKSEMLFVQIIGRALRLAAGKDHALILDHTDTTSRLGFVTDIHHDTLDAGKLDKNAPAKPRGPPLPKPCPKCAYLLAVGVKTCPECGFERAPPQSKLFEREGQLVELDPNGRPQRRRDRRRYPYSYEEKRAFYLQLRAYAQGRSYKSTWPDATYRSKFDEWPAWSWKVLPAAERIGREVRQFIQAKFIAWANDPRNPRRKVG